MSFWPFKRKTPKPRFVHTINVLSRHETHHIWHCSCGSNGYSIFPDLRDKQAREHLAGRR